GIATHKAHIASILHDLKDIACQQRAASVCALGPMTDSAAFKMAATVNEGQPVPEWPRGSFPKDNGRVWTHHPLAISCMQVDRRAPKSLAPLHHAGIVVGVRDGNRGNAPHSLNRGDRRIIEQGNAIPEQVAARALEQQAALADGKFWLAADAG